MAILSYSQLSTFFQCPRKYWYSYIQRRIPLQLSAPLYRGRLWDAAVGLLWHSGKSAALEWLTLQRTEQNEQLIIKLRCAISSYHIAKFQLIERLAIQAPSISSQQQKATILVVHPYSGEELCQLLTVVDGLMDTSRGTMIFETKLTELDLSDSSGFWVRRSSFDLQTSVYFLAHPTATAVIIDAQRYSKHTTSKKDMDIAIRRNMVRSGHISSQDSKIQGHLESTYKTIGYLYGELLDAFESRMAIQYEDPSYHTMKVYPKTEINWEQAQSNCFAACSLLLQAIEYNLFPQSSNSCAMGQHVCEYHKVCSGREELGDCELYKDK